MHFKPTRFQNLQASPPTNPQPTSGAGDLVARIAKPVARVLDRVLGTDLKNCQGCEQRRIWLNQFKL